MELRWCMVATNGYGLLVWAFIVRNMKWFLFGCLMYLKAMMHLTGLWSCTFSTKTAS